MVGTIRHTGEVYHVVDVKLTIPRGNSMLKQKLKGEKVVFDDHDSDGFQRLAWKATYCRNLARLARALAWDWN
jgi:hypothetical protein